MTETQLTTIAGDVYRVQGFDMILHRGDLIQARLIDTGIHEWAETALVPQFIRTGATVIDVGANIGYYCLVFSRLVGANGTVYAFEPLPSSYDRLCANVRLNNANVVALNLALGDAEAVTTHSFDPNCENHGGWSLESSLTPGGAVEVTTIRLDDFIRERGIARVRFLKLDVEGFELRVLTGGAECISKHRPIIMVEYLVEDGKADLQRLFEMTTFLKAHGYTICRIVKTPWPHIREIIDADFDGPIHFNAICYHGRHPIHP